MLAHLLPPFRGARDLSINGRFLIGPDKNEILRNLQFGFRAYWAPVMPPVSSKARNFLRGKIAIAKARARFVGEVKKGRMLGGMGWSLKKIEKFLKRKVYIIPCGAVPKNNDPCGRIIHDYSHPDKKVGSINSALTYTSVNYITFKERVAQLAQVDWFLKVDLKNGYRQLPVHPSDWHTQVYSLGPNEFYIDITMPFGKANSARVFCMWTSAWCESFKFHFHRQRRFSISLSVYMDDFFGGPIRTGSLTRDLKNARKLFEDLITMGAVTNTHMNIQKCEEPARSMDILGLNFNSELKACFLAKAKSDKYKTKLTSMRNAVGVTSKNLQRLIGYLVYAAWVVPYGRPFISHISHFIDEKNMHKKVSLDVAALVACDIWLFLLEENHGLPFNHILGKLPRQKEEWYADASSQGYGGICGTSYFKISHTKLLSLVKSTAKIKFRDIFIAYRELLAVLLAFQVFARIAPQRFIRINSDNTNVVSWLNKGRCSKQLGFLLLSAIEFFKYKFGLRVKAYYIKSKHNTSADCLSRGHTPQWLGWRGVKLKNDVNEIIQLLDDPLPFWQTKKRDYPL